MKVIKMRVFAYNLKVIKIKKTQARSNEASKGNKVQVWMNKLHMRISV